MNMDSITTIVIEGAGSNGVDGHYIRADHLFRHMNHENHEIHVRYWRNDRIIIDGEEQRDEIFLICTETQNNMSPWLIGCLRRVNHIVTFITLYQTEPLQQPVGPPGHGWQPSIHGQTPSPTLRYHFDFSRNEQEAAFDAGEARLRVRNFFRRIIEEFVDVRYHRFSEYQRQRPLMNETTCPICLKEIALASTIAILNCNCYRENNQQDRIIHSRCLEDLFMSGFYWCPMCRYPLRN